MIYKHLDIIVGRSARLLIEPRIESSNPPSGRIIGLDELGMLNNKTIISYINRLSDLLFMLARYEDKDLPVEVITGQKLDE